MMNLAIPDLAGIENEAIDLAATDVLVAAKDLFDLFAGAREFTVRISDDGQVRIYLPNGTIKWMAP
jgi:hypothetical protein